MMIGGELDRRPLIALTLAVVAWMSIGASVEPSAALPRSPASDASSVEQLELSRARHARSDHAGNGTDGRPLAAVHSPSSAPPFETYVGDNGDYYVYLPLVSRPEIEARALWVTRWDYSNAADVQGLVENAASAGFNMVLFQVRGTADAYYESDIEPWAARLSGTLGVDPGWDPLETAVNAAHAHGLELHAYINVYTVWAGEERPPAACDPPHLYWTLSALYQGVDPAYPTGAWRVYGSDYRPMLLNAGYLFATPAIPDIELRVTAVARDIINRYAVDGIHLDLVRYPGPDYSYDPTTEAALAQTGLPRAEYQRQRVTQLVSRIYSEAILPRSDVWLSAAVWPVYADHWGWGTTEGYSDLYQDSQGWVKSGVIDAIFPMIYPANVFASPNPFPQDRFATLTSDFLANSGGRHVLPGISAQYDDFGQIADRIAIARDEGAPGHAVFSARLVEQRGYWDDFSSGPYAHQAMIPPMSWR